MDLAKNGAAALTSYSLPFRREKNNTRTVSVNQEEVGHVELFQLLLGLRVASGSL